MSMADWSVRHLRRALSCGVLLLCCFAGRVAAQEMQPRAYIPAPIGLNFFSFGYANNSGDMLFDPGLPVEDAKVKADVFTMAFGQSLGVLGRTAQALVVVPYVVANLDGLYVGSQTHLYRSGIGDVALRYAMNIYGAPAMRGKQLASYKQKTIVGASITVSAPTGQYDPARLINIGSNRWAFKPEIGVSRAFGKWSVEGAGGVWLYTENHHFNGSAVRTALPSPSDLAGMRWDILYRSAEHGQRGGSQRLHWEPAMGRHLRVCAEPAAGDQGHLLRWCAHAGRRRHPVDRDLVQLHLAERAITGIGI
jgi:hypothetical protein